MYPTCLETIAIYPAGAGTGTAAVGPDYGCLLTLPNPAWFFFEVSTGGNIDIEISNSNNEDLDFILYGPFVDQISPCTTLLTAGNTEDCSYSTSATEIANIVGAIPGEFYMMLITNFSNNATDISYNILPSSTGTTNCINVCPPIDFGVWNGVSTEPLASTMDCDDASVILLADQDGFNTAAAITPCIAIQVFPTSTNTALSIEFFENGSSLGTEFPAPNTNYTGDLGLAQPSVSHAFILNEGSATGINMTYQVFDCHTGAALASRTWVSDGNPQTVTVNPPPNLSGTTIFSITPAAGIPGLTSTDGGGGTFDPSLVPTGSYDITYSWNNGTGNCSGTSTHTVTVSNPHHATLNWEYKNPHGLSSRYQGSSRRLPAGNTVIDWAAAIPYTTSELFSEVDPAGNIVMELDLPDQYISYRIVKHELPFKLNRPIINCSSSGTFLEAPSGYEEYYWNTGDTTANIMIADTGNYQVWINYGIGYLASYTFHVNNIISSCGTTSINDVENTVLNYYPNPLKNELTIEITSNLDLPKFIPFIDISGRSVNFPFINHGDRKIKINLSKLSTGYYFFTYNGGQYPIIKL
ncbi:MAG: hypothetical protein ACI9J3_001095 [Parvicellaceae bacterium]